jgi:3-oxoacyl-[acyl-carrier-protein] synthase-3
MSQYPANENTVKNKQHFVKMEGQDVFKFAVRVIPNAVKKLLKRANMTLDDVKLIIPHQANTRIIESAAKLLKVDYEKFYVNIQKYGNTSSATIPIAMDEAIEEGKIKEGDIIITVGFGAGLTYAANLIRF